MRRLGTLLAFTVLVFVLFVACALAIEWAGNGYYLASGKEPYLHNHDTEGGYFHGYYLE